MEASIDVKTAAEDAGGSVEADLLELVRLMPPVVRGLKRRASEQSGAGGAQPLRALLAAGSLGPRHLPVIVVLAFDGPLTVSELARRIGLGVAATSLMVSDLDRVGIVRREVDDRDRRRTLVSLAEPLREPCVRFARERLAPLRDALERMGPQTREHFVAGWRVLAEVTGTAAEGTPVAAEDASGAADDECLAAE